MAYILNFPQALDYMRDSQPFMLANYAAIFDFVGEDHVNFNTGADAGKHAQLTFPAAAPTPDDANEWIMYAQIAAVPSSNFIDIFTKNASNVVIPFSQKSLDGDLEQTVESFRLPSGIIIKWVQIPMWNLSEVVRTFVWSSGGDAIPFTTQYWAAVFIQYDLQNTNQDPWQYATVIDVSNPAQVKYAVWNRSPFFLSSAQNSYPVLICAIGV